MEAEDAAVCSSILYRAARRSASSCSILAKRSLSFAAASCTLALAYIFFRLGVFARIASYSRNLVGTPFSRQMAAIFNGERGSVGLSTTSLMPNAVPSTSFTVTTSFFGPLNSTRWTDLAESLRMVSNSVVDTIGIAWTMAGTKIGESPTKAFINELAKNVLRHELEELLRTLAGCWLISLLLLLFMRMTLLPGILKASAPTKTRAHSKIAKALFALIIIVNEGNMSNAKESKGSRY